MKASLLIGALFVAAFVLMLICWLLLVCGRTLEKIVDAAITDERRFDWSKFRGE